MSLFFCFAPITESQTVTIFVGQDAKIYSQSKIFGDCRFVFQSKSENVKTTRKINLQNTDKQQSIVAKRVKTNKHKEIVFNPFSPFGNQTFFGKYLFANAALQEDYHNIKLFATNIYQFLFLEKFNTSEFFQINTSIAITSDIFDFVQGNLPPPRNKTING
ncbi:MAG: hypothetical protein FWD66_05200 [Paludibacter sp.]|nr:hypothetical protein [Paludibacter sp.]